MELDLKIAEFVSIFFQWQEDHPAETREVRFEYLEATDTTLNFRANGMLFQLLLPAGLLYSDVEPGEIFIAMNLDNSAPNSLMVSLNEKLERVPIGPQALALGLDVFAKALISFEGKRKRPQKQQSVRGANGKGLLHDVALAIERSKVHSNPRDGHEENCFNDDSDLEMGPEDCLAQSKRGYLHEMIREFRNKCLAARRRSAESFLYIPFNLTYSGANLMLYVDDILQFCTVSPVSDIQVSVEVEVAGIVNDVKIASCLGLPCSKTIKIFLEFDKRDIHKPLLLSRVAVDPEAIGPANFANAVDANGTETEKGSDDEFEAECKKFRGRQRTAAYGPSVLLPELIQTFFRFRSGETALRATSWENRNLDEALKAFAAVDNVFIGLICFVGSQLKALPSWCTVCWSLLPTSVWRLRTCQNDLCLYEFEELGLGATIHHEIQESPEVVELELSLACAAASSERDVFEPFPSFFLACDELRGRSGWFSGPSQQFPNRAREFAQRSEISKKLDICRDPQPQRQVGKRRCVSQSDEISPKENKRLALLLKVLQSIPSIADLRESADESTLKKKLSKAAFSVWRKKDRQSRSEQCQMWLSYDLMRFILSSNRSSLRILKGAEELEIKVKPKFQFVVLHDSPEKEAIFDQRRSQSGSFFAFHGSSFCNWYSILRNGLRPMSNTKYMSTGAAHGKGIYLADNFSQSYQYAKNRYGCWKNGTLKEGSIVIAICEVVAGSCSKSLQSIYVVPPGQEDNISVRYLLVIDGTDLARVWSPLTITGCMLSDHDQTIDLREKYERLREADQEQQQQVLLTCRMEAFFRLKGDGSCPETDAQCVDNMWSSPATTDRSSSASPGLEEDSPTSRLGDSMSPREEVYSPMVVMRSDGHTAPTSQWVNENNSADTRPSVTATAVTAAQGVIKKQKKRHGEGDPDTRRPALPASATQAIAKEFKTVQNEIRKSKQGASSCSGPVKDSFLSHITVNIPDEADLSVWHVMLSQNLFTSYANLYKDLQKLADLKMQPESSVLLEVTFSGMFPFEPPFIRVIRPKFLFHTGHVTVGGSICMELLTTTGWLPSFSFENVLVQIVNAFVEGEGRVDMKAIGQEYSKEEAQKAFTRVAGLHGWTVGRSKR